LIDDMDQTPPTGSIYSKSGRVGAWYTYNDETAGGQQSPEMGATFLPDAGGRNGTNSAHTAGSGFTNWGAGMGFDLNNNGTTKLPWDASMFTGFAFWAKGTAFRVKVLVPATVPTAEGGSCSAGTCGDNHGKAIEAATDWHQVVVPFSSLTQEGWGATAAFTANQVIGIQFQTAKSTTFDVWIDDIGFY
jgi:hypothetical protein